MKCASSSLGCPLLLATTITNAMADQILPLRPPSPTHHHPPLPKLCPHFPDFSLGFPKCDSSSSGHPLLMAATVAATTVVDQILPIQPSSPTYHHPSPPSMHPQFPNFSRGFPKCTSSSLGHPLPLAAAAIVVAVRILPLRPLSLTHHHPPPLRPCPHHRPLMSCPPLRFRCHRVFSSPLSATTLPPAGALSSSLPSPSTPSRAIDPHPKPSSSWVLLPTMSCHWVYLIKN